jgi:hypothetical protein
LKDCKPTLNERLKKAKQVFEDDYFISGQTGFGIEKQL